MSTTERETPSRELVLKHARTDSFTDRGNIPMWDSADPERAPPPLPLNPGGGGPTTRSNASATIQAAAAAIAEKSHENTPSSYTVNPMPLKPSSPEKSLIKGQYHKRMQSLQNTTNSREFASYLERRSPEKTHRASICEPESNSPDRASPVRAAGPSTPPGKESPNPRISNRFLSKPILGENTPPSATMLALQNMQLPIEIESPSNRSISSVQTQKQPGELDSLSTQIISLTNIATALQQEMSQLSRRSKDNATDLISLKAATNARDEDIRKSLKDLTSNLSTKLLEAEATPRPSSFSGRSSLAGPYMLDNKESSPTSRKSYSLPRIPSPSSFTAAIEREFAASPGAISSDGSASIALLEKVLREMATKEGQEQLTKLVDEMKSGITDRSTDSSMSKMLEEILNVVKDNSGSQALVRSWAQPENSLDFNEDPNHGQSGTPTPRGLGSSMNNAVSSQPASLPTEDILNILGRVKQSVSEGGGLTNEVKALVRELRGEVLGMGREIGRKLEEAEAQSSTKGVPEPGPSSDEIARIVEDGLVHLRRHMEHVIEQNRAQLESSPSLCRPPIDNNEMYAIVKKAIVENYPEQPTLDLPPGLEREEILETVREAWETYKPEIELQNFGLERDEILECLTEGLKQHQPAEKESVEPGATYDQVLDAINIGLENFTPPRVEPDISSLRDEVVATVRECLESFEWPVPPAVLDREALNRDDVLSAVKEGLVGHESAPKEPEFNREEMFEAVRAGFHDASGSMSHDLGENVIDHFHGLVTDMKDEFKQYSAANGRDTEQVLDAVKDGLEVLRGEIESYVDRASDVTGKDEIIDTVKDGFRLLQVDIEKSIAESSTQNHPTDTVELLDAMEKEFEHLRQTLSSLLIRTNVSSDKDEILDAIRDISESGNLNNDKNLELSTTLKDEFAHLRDTLTMAIVKPDSSSTDKDEIVSALRETFESLLDDHMHRKDGAESVLSNTGELLDAFHDGVDALRADMDKILNKPSDSGPTEEILDVVRDGLAGIQAEMQQLRDYQKESEDSSTTRGREVMLASEVSIGSDIESLKALVTQLQVKVENIDPKPTTPEEEPDTVKKEDLVELLDAIKTIQDTVAEVGSREAPLEGTAKKEDTDAIALIMDNMKSQLDEIASSNTASFVAAERMEGLEALTKEMKDLMNGFVAHVEVEGPSKSDVANLETIIKDIWVAVEDLKNNSPPATEEPEEEKTDKVVREDLQNLETLLFEMKSQLDEFVLPDVETLPTKDDLGTLTHLVTEFREKVEADGELTAQAFESRKIEHGGLAEKIEDAKSILLALGDELKGKLADGDESLGDLKTMVMCINESAESFAKANSIKELVDLVHREFERSHGDREAAKMEGEEQRSEMMAKQEEGRTAILADLGTKIDDKINEVISKYDDAQTALDTKFTGVEDRDMDFLETLTTTKTVAEDIKLVIGGMGNTLSEACDKMADDAKTFFERVDQSFVKVDDLHTEVKTQHEDVTSQFEKALAATDRLERQIADSHPEILTAVKDILAIVGQHYEHSQKTTNELRTDLTALPSAITPLLLPPPEPETPKEIPVYEKYDDSQVQEKLDNLLDKTDATSKTVERFDKLDETQEFLTTLVQEKLDQLLDRSDDSSKAVERYGQPDETQEFLTTLVQEKLEEVLEKVNNTSNSEERFDKLDESQDWLRDMVQEKLDSLIESASATTKSVERFDKLDVINEQLSTMIQEVNEMTVAQSRLATENHESKRQEAMETAIALEKRLAQKEKVEAEVVSLNAEKGSLIQTIQALKQENDGLLKQHIRLNKDVAGMETALRIRREEVQLMEDRAEDLERRIVEGVLDHARSQLLSRNGGASNMGLRRVPSSASTVTRGSAVSTSKESSILGSGINVALKRRTPVPSEAPSTLSSNGGKERRILSLSQLNGNRAPNRQSINGPSGGLTNLKRSHSVKSNFQYRKTSWDVRNSLANKENEVFEEEDEEESDGVSDTGTERRTSYTGTYDSMSYITGSTVSTDRSTSYSSTNGLVAAEPGSLVDESVDGDSIDETASEGTVGEYATNQSEVYGTPENERDDRYAEEELDADGTAMVLYAERSDSGLGTDIPTCTSEKEFKLAPESVAG